MDKAELTFIKLAEEKDKLTGSKKLLIGGLAGAISTAAVQPISQITNIKSTFGDNPNWAGRADTYWNAAKSIYRKDLGETAASAIKYTKGLKGVSNFYRGLGGKLVQTAPQSALLLGLNAILYKLYNQHKKKNG